MSINKVNFLPTSNAEIAGYVQTALEHVKVCNDIMNNNTINEENESIIENNKEYLRIMLSKLWFTKALTSQQKTELETCLAAARNYLGLPSQRIK